MEPELAAAIGETARAGCRQLDDSPPRRAATSSCATAAGGYRPAALADDNARAHAARLHADAAVSRGAGNRRLCPRFWPNRPGDGLEAGRFGPGTWLGARPPSAGCR